MKHIFLVFSIILLFNACSIKNNNIKNQALSKQDKNIQSLSFDVQSLSKEISKSEALKISYEAITYSKKLANKYKVTTTALFHNTLINLNIKKRGYCYHYANDLHRYLKTKKFKSFKFIRAVSKRGEYFEHSSLVLTRDDLSFEDSLILDAWRDTGDLFWSRVKDDNKYKWEKK